MSNWQVKVLTPERYVKLRDNLRAQGRSWPEGIARTGKVPVYFSGDQFTTVCPDCGTPLRGSLGDEPVLGSVTPQWVRSGDNDRLTLSPTIGCPRYTEDTSGHHFILRNGMLERA